MLWRNPFLRRHIGKPTVTIIQTADATRYRRMLDATARTAREYCRRHDHRYDSYVGVRRGPHGWQASFNRIFQMNDLMEAGYRGWVLHMDADAYVSDLDVSLADYLADKAMCAGVMTTIPGSLVPWSINSGVMMVNLAHPEARRMVALWLAAFMAFDEDWLARTTQMLEWDNDQQMLFLILDREPAIREAIHYDDGAFMNLADSRFVRHYLAIYERSLEVRTDTVERLTDEVLDRAWAALPAWRRWWRSLSGGRAAMGRPDA